MSDLSDERHEAKLSIDVTAVLQSTQNAVVTSSEMVDFVLNAMENADLSAKPSAANTQYKFKTPDISADQRRANFETWLFTKAFSDLMRGVRSSLEQAYIAIQLISGVQVPANSTLQSVLAPIEEKAGKMKFGQLLDAVNERLPQPLAFSDAFESMQKARNCFEHRNGVIGPIDAPAGGVMILRFPRAKMFYLKDGKEVELEPGHTVNDGAGTETVQIYFRLDVRERRFGLGQRIGISHSDFNEIAFACNQFATQLYTQILSLGKTASPSNSTEQQEAETAK